MFICSYFYLTQGLGHYRGMQPEMKHSLVEIAKAHDF